jgi:hypothetical protein
MYMMMQMPSGMNLFGDEEAAGLPACMCERCAGRVMYNDKTR